MKYLLIYFSTFFVLLPVLSGSQKLHADDFSPAFAARYRVTFEAVWSRTTHPDQFPPGPHFSPLIGMTHQSSATLWQSGRLASEGIEQMAELGATGVLSDEVSALIEAAQAEFILSGSGIGLSPGFTSFEFDITQAFPLVSLVSMIAPSPDWFIGINSFNLRQNGQWIEQTSVELFPYDSGTDSGLTFTSSNADTNPAEPIARINDSPFANSAPLGRFNFQLIETNSNVPISGNLSGLYYDPDRSGEGINLLITKQDQRNIATLNWYTYHNNQQLWLVGNTDYQEDSDQLTIDLSSSQGSGFGPAFNPAAFELVPWGSVTLTFPSCDRVIIDYTSSNPAFGSGRQELVKLLGVADLKCE
ncbi:MAG: spondin domain-containing protein [Gammaproteobacteria bacterium]|nr:spondin domain-containing protein [Gammaproteobacteria bacterium]